MIYFKQNEKMKQVYSESKSELINFLQYILIENRFEPYFSQSYLHSAKGFWYVNFFGKYYDLVNETTIQKFNKEVLNNGKEI